MDHGDYGSSNMFHWIPKLPELHQSPQLPEPRRNFCGLNHEASLDPWTVLVNALHDVSSMSLCKKYMSLGKEHAQAQRIRKSETLRETKQNQSGDPTFYSVMQVDTCST